MGGLKTNPWVDLHAIVTVFDSGGSSGVLRDELGVLPPGDVLKCALALARSEAEARELLLTRLPLLEHERLAGHTGGNLLLSMMEQYTGDFVAAADALRMLLGCGGRVWPITVERATLCATYHDGSSSRGEFHVDAGQTRGAAIRDLWLDPPVALHPAVAGVIRSLDAVVIGPGSFYTSLLPIFLVQGCREAFSAVRGPIIYIANLLTEGRGMAAFTAADAVGLLSNAIGRPIDVVLVNADLPSPDVLDTYAREEKRPLPVGRLPESCEVVEGKFWRGPIARHDRQCVSAAVWAVLADKLLLNSEF